MLRFSALNKTLFPELLTANLTFMKTQSYKTNRLKKKIFFLPNLQQSHTIKIIEIYQELEKQ